MNATTSQKKILEHYLKIHERKCLKDVNLYDPEAVPLVKENWKIRVLAQALNGGFRKAGAFDGIDKSFYTDIGCCAHCIDRWQQKAIQSTSEKEKAEIGKIINNARNKRKTNALTEKIEALNSELDLMQDEPEHLTASWIDLDLSGYFETTRAEVCIHCWRKLERLMQVVDRDFLRKVINNKSAKRDIFSQKLVPLNKVAPDIPTVSEYRPIAVMSHSMKFMEIAILPELKRYVDDKNNLVNQYGFKANSSIYTAQKRLK